MPISLSAKKSLRKSLTNKKDNVSFKNKMRKTIKEFLAKPSNEALKGVSSVLDKAVKKGLEHKNKVARLKSRFSKLASGKAVAKVVVAKKTAAAKKITAQKVAAQRKAKKMS